MREPDYEKLPERELLEMIAMSARATAGSLRRLEIMVGMASGLAVFGALKHLGWLG